MNESDPCTGQMWGSDGVSYKAIYRRGTYSFVFKMLFKIFLLSQLKQFLIFDILQKMDFSEPINKCWVIWKLWSLNGHFQAEADRKLQANQAAWPPPGWSHTKGRGSTQLAEAAPFAVWSWGAGSSLPGPFTLPPAPISQEATLKLESDLGLILSSLRETEASLLSEITTAVTREVWGKYFNKESWEFQLQLGEDPRGTSREHEWKFAAWGQGTSLQLETACLPRTCHSSIRGKSKGRNAIHQTWRGLEPSCPLFLVPRMPHAGGRAPFTRCSVRYCIPSCWRGPMGHTHSVSFLLPCLGEMLST